MRLRKNNSAAHDDQPKSGGHRRSSACKVPCLDRLEHAVGDHDESNENREQSGALASLAVASREQRGERSEARACGDCRLALIRRNLQNRPCGRRPQQGRRSGFEKQAEQAQACTGAACAAATRPKKQGRK